MKYTFAPATALLRASLSSRATRPDQLRSRLPAEQAIDQPDGSSQQDQQAQQQPDVGEQTHAMCVHDRPIVRHQEKEGQQQRSEQPIEHVGPKDELSGLELRRRTPEPPKRPTEKNQIKPFFSAGEFGVPVRPSNVP